MGIKLDRVKSAFEEFMQDDFRYMVDCATRDRQLYGDRYCSHVWLIPNGKYSLGCRDTTAPFYAPFKTKKGAVVVIPPLSEDHPDYSDIEVLVRQEFNQAFSLLTEEGLKLAMAWQAKFSDRLAEIMETIEPEMAR